jgi:hypothetical protein
VRDQFAEPSIGLDNLRAGQMCLNGLIAATCLPCRLPYFVIRGS